MSHLIFLYHLLIVLALVVILLNFLLNQIAVPRLVPRSIDDPQRAPFVSILVPARNEATVIARCLRSLQTQDYPHYEILLLDDQSTDRTAAIAGELGFAENHPHHRLLSGQPLPSEWVGKPWACHQLSQNARGDYLLFTDADTVHAPGALSAVIAEALENKSDLLTLWPCQETRTWSEKLIIPILFIAVAGLLPHWFIVLAQKHPRLRQSLSDRQWKALGAANGQYLLFTRAAYQRIGGHLAVKNHLVEDVTLGRLVGAELRQGMILRHADGGGLVSTRMYQSFPQLWEGFTKNLWPVFDGDLRLFILCLSLQFLLFVGPFLFIFLAHVTWLMLLFQIVLLYFIRLIFALRYQTSWLGALFHPLGYLLLTAIACNSYRQNKKTGLTWKGRTYHVGPTA